MAAITTVEDVKVWLGPGHDDALVDDAYTAAEEYVGNRCSWDDTEEAPADLVMAVNFQTARYLARRSSPDGLVGMNEFGPARVTITDRDVADAMAPYRIAVLG